jgi:heat shock protein HslJ
MRRAPRAILSILAAAPLLVGVPALAQSPSPVQVLDVEWTLSQLAGEAVPDAPPITATFATDGSLTGSGGCNDYSATWSSDGSTLTVSPVLATFKACSEEVDARESSYFTLIQDAASWSLEGAAITVTTTSGETLVFGDEADVPDALALVGDWTLGTVDGQAPPAGMVVTLSIGADGTLTGLACNTYNATYTATQTGDLAIDPIVATRKSCGDAQDAFEFSYLDGLQGAIGWGTQIGKLTLFGTTELVFGDGSAQDATLTGQEWSLVTIGGAPLPAGSGITASFGEDGTVTGSGGCNQYTGPYTVDGESLSVGPLAATRMSCGQVSDDLESTYLGALEAAMGFAISGTDLVISTSNGVTLELSTSSGPVEPSQPPVEPSQPPVEPSPSPEPSNAAASPGASVAVVAGDIVGSWKMTGYAGSALPAGMLAIDITFADDGTFSGFGGCNDYSGQWSLSGTSLSISGFEAASSGTCDELTQGLETGYFGLVPFLDTAELAADGSLSVASSFAPAQGFTFVRAD